MKLLKISIPIIIFSMLTSSVTAQVGIGTLTPEETLHVAGNVKVNDTLNVAGVLKTGISSEQAVKLNGLDTNNALTDVTLGSNLTLSSGVLSASGGDDRTKENIVLINETFGTKNDWDLGLDGANSDVTVFIIRKGGGTDELIIKGIDGGSEGRKFRIINDSNKKIKFDNEDDGAAGVGNKYYNYTGSVELNKYGSCLLIYSTAISDDTGHWNIVQLDSE